MPVAPNLGVDGKFGMAVDATATPATATERYELLSEGLATEREIIRTDGLRGSRMHPVSRIRQGRQTPSGTIAMEPTYAELVLMLTRLIGANAGGTYTVSDTVPVYFQTIIDRVAKVYTYTGCKVDKGTIKFGQGTTVMLDMSIEACTESIGNANTFGAAAISATAPFIFADSTLTLGGTAYQVFDVEISIDWHLKKDRWVNSLTRTDLPSMDFTCMTKFTVPYTSDTVGLYDGGIAGITGSLNVNFLGAGGGAAGVSMLCTFGNLVFPAAKSPTVGSKDEITLTLAGESRQTGATSPLVIVLDSTV